MGLLKYKKWIILILVPIGLLPIFYMTDDRPMVCPEPCKMHSGYAERKSCESSWAYAKGMCTKRCLECNAGDYDCLQKWVKAGYSHDADVQKSVLKILVSKTSSDPEFKSMKPQFDKVFKFNADEQLDGSCIETPDTSDTYLDTNLLASNGFNYTAKPLQFYDNVFNYKKAACLYGMLIMVIYWVFEVIPLPVTALFPLFGWPLLGVMPASKVALNYFNNVNCLFFGGLTVAVGVEVTHLDKRLALSVLRMVGADPVFLLLGFMSITSFLSMWISNVATTAMILPIGVAVLEQLKANIDKEAGEVENGEAQSLMKNTNNDDENDEKAKNSSDPMVSKYYAQKQFSKALTLAVCYCASIGGIGMPTGTGPNLIFMGMLPAEAGASFGSFAILNAPMTIIMTLIAWGMLWFVFIRGTKKYSNSEKELVTGIIENQYQSLGPMSHAEKSVGFVFGVLACLWLTRSPAGGKDGGLVGWGDALTFRDTKNKAYITDSTAAIFMTFILFILPEKSFSEAMSDKGVYKPILTFKYATSKLPWNVLFILGGGFAMAQGVTQTRLAQWISSQLGFLQGMNPLLISLVICYIVAFTSQAAANSATITIFLPILKSLAPLMQVNPLLLMVPATAAVSCAFVLPVSTPPNAVAFGYGYLKIGDMAKVGSVLVMVTVLITVLLSYTLGAIAYPDMFNECAGWWVEMAGDAELTARCI